jgi:hypothetical protein
MHRPQLRGDIEFRNVRSPTRPQRLGARGHQLQDRRRRTCGADRPRGLGQVHHPAAHHGPVPAHRRRRAARRHRPAPARPGRRAPQPGLRVAGRDAVLRHAAREHHHGPALCGRPGAVVAAADTAGLPSSSTATRAGSTCRWANAAICSQAGSARSVGLARAVLHNAPILLLDEPTSAMDFSTEAQITAQGDRLRTGQDGGAGDAPHLDAGAGQPGDRGRRRQASSPTGRATASWKRCRPAANREGRMNRREAASRRSAGVRYPGGCVSASNP